MNFTQIESKTGNEEDVYTMSISDKQFIEGFADGYARFGATHLMGRIMAILILEEEPLSLGEISRKLGASKGPVSTEARKLEMLWTVEKIKRGGDRKVFYKPVEDPFVMAMDRNIEQIRKNMHVAGKWLDQEELEEIPEEIRERVERMKNFYKYLVGTMQEFSAQWKKGDIK